MDKFEEFTRLYREFVRGTESLNYHFKKGGRNPFFAKEEARFKEKIVEPMDAAWRGLDAGQRAAVWPIGQARPNRPPFQIGGAQR
jgi:hypothetical protein